MPSRFTITTVLCVSALVFALGPHGGATAVPLSKASAQVVPAPDLATSLNLSVDDAVGFTLNVTNNSGKRLELAFPSGQTHDFAVLDSVGREVWRWSAGRMFTQSIISKLLDARQTVTYQERWKLPADLHGRFTAVAVLNTRNAPLERRIDFELQ